MTRISIFTKNIIKDFYFKKSIKNYLNIDKHVGMVTPLRVLRLPSGFSSGVCSFVETPGLFYRDPKLTIPFRNSAISEYKNLSV